jgi:flagellar hook-associated protein 1 FlgK
VGDFSGLQIGVSALWAQRRAMETAGQNMANAATEGYTRQQVDLRAAGGSPVPAMWSRTNGVGEGVSVDGVQRVSDQFLTARATQELGTLSRLQARQTMVGNAERVFGEPSDTGLQAQFADLWSGFDDVANHPDDLASRNQLLQRASTVAASVNQASNGLSALWMSTREQLDTVVSDVNTTAQNLAELNRTIQTGVQSGLTVNELMDQRDRLVTHLSEMVGATSRAGEDGSIDVMIGGTALVRGSSAQALKVTGPAQLTSPAGAVGIVWAKDGYAADLQGGKAAGMLDGLNVSVPTYMTRLDNVATTLASKVNGLQTTGYDLNGALGTAFFTGTSAKDLAVAITDPKQIAASKTGPDPITGKPSLDGSNAADLAELSEDSTGADQVYRAFIVDIGVEVQSTNRRTDIQAGVFNQVDRARRSVSEVNTDEEAAHMMAFQHAYEGAARYLTAVDQMLDTLINRTGLVGR